jgi:hypothetical protein
MAASIRFAVALRWSFMRSDAAPEVRCSVPSIAAAGTRRSSGGRGPACMIGCEITGQEPCRELYREARHALAKITTEFCGTRKRTRLR